MKEAIEQAIVGLKTIANGLCEVDKIEFTQHLDLARQALEEKLERENPKALTIEDLANFEWGDAIWIQYLDFDADDKYYDNRSDGWKIVNSISDEFIDFEDDIEEDLCQYGTEWIAYAHRPKPESEIK